MEKIDTTNGTTIYIDYKTRNVIIAKKMLNNSYSFYAAKMHDDQTVHFSDFTNLTPIQDIFEFLEQNNLDMDLFPYSQEIGEKQYENK